MQEPLKGASGFVLKPPILMLVTDRELTGGEDALVNAVEAAVEGGVNAVQLREKDMRPADLLPLACRLREVTEGKALFLVNGPLEIAKEAGADGVHLPEEADPPPPPWTFTWGRSVHTGEGGIMALGEAPRYLIAGPVFETRSHPGRPPAGLDLIREIVPIASPKPVIGIGGITTDNARDVMQAGAKGVAVISAILGSDDPKAAAQRMREAFRWTIV
jgi:thiamine-phosphate pyrophosphorylase